MNKVKVYELPCESWDEVYSISGLVQEDFEHDPVGCADDFTECLQCLMALEGKE